MVKKIAIVASVVLVAAMLLGCSSSAPKDEQPREPQDLVLVDSNYVLSHGYVEYALEIQNPNEQYAADFVTITVTSKHADGTIGFSDEWVVSNIMPGSTSYWASQAGNGDTVEADIIEIALAVNEGAWNKTGETIPANLYSFENVSVSPAQFSGLTAKGEITLNEDFELRYTDAKSPMLVCILKDGDGAIVAGFSGYMSKNLDVGVPSVFDIDSMFDVADYASAELYANIW